MGHFFPAKWFGCRVEKFYLFFNPWFSLWKKKKGETEYGLGWIPLGGYVKISGMIDESMDKEAMKQPAKPWEFRSKPAWQRLIIMLGGVIVNFILALIIFSAILFKWGEEKLPIKNMTHGVIADSIGLAAGFRDGDKIVAINKKPIQYANDISKNLFLNTGVNVTVNRDGRDTTLILPPGTISQLTRTQQQLFLYPRTPVVIDGDDKVKYVSGKLEKNDKIVGINGSYFEFFDDYVDVKKPYKDTQITLHVQRAIDTVDVVVKTNENSATGIAIVEPGKLLGTEKIEYGFFESIPAGIKFGVERLKDYMRGIRLLFTSKEHRFQDNLGSVITIGKTFGGEWDWKRFWTMTALFSIILAFMNILPIPALDGGHALFTLIEMITGRKPGDKFMEYAQMVGMILLLALMLYAFGLDIWRLFK